MYPNFGHIVCVNIRFVHIKCLKQINFTQNYFGKSLDTCCQSSNSIIQSHRGNCKQLTVRYIVVPSPCDDKRKNRTVGNGRTIDLIFALDWLIYRLIFLSGYLRAIAYMYLYSRYCYCTCLTKTSHTHINSMTILQLVFKCTSTNNWSLKERYSIGKIG